MEQPFSCVCVLKRDRMHVRVCVRVCDFVHKDVVRRQLVSVCLSACTHNLSVSNSSLIIFQSFPSLLTLRMALFQFQPSSLGFNCLFNSRKSVFCSMQNARQVSQ